MSYSYTMKGFTLPDFHVSLALTGSEEKDMTKLQNLAVTQDKTAANSVKLAGADDEVLGIIFHAENGASQGEGITVTVALKGGFSVPYGGDAPAIGDMIAGAGAGKVGTIDSTKTKASHGRVWEVDTANKEVVVYFE